MRRKEKVTVMRANCYVEIGVSELGPLSHNHRTLLNARSRLNQVRADYFDTITPLQPIGWQKEQHQINALSDLPFIAVLTIFVWLRQILEQDAYAFGGNDVLRPLIEAAPGPA
jgi:hypothetical protein